MLSTKNLSSLMIVCALSTILVSGIVFGVAAKTAYADCDLPGNEHGDNNPSENKGEDMIEDGASACEIAKASDAMKIEVDIDSKDELHDTEMYQSASDNVKEELDEYMEDGNGADGLVGYEIEDAVKAD